MLYYANRLKTTYQRNLTCGMIVGVLLVVLYTAFLQFTREPTIIVTLGGGQGRELTPPGGLPPGMIPDHRRPVVAWNRGPIDPDRMEVVTDSPVDGIPIIASNSPRSGHYPDFVLGNVGYGHAGIGGGGDDASGTYDPNFDDYANCPDDPGGFNPSAIRFPSLSDILIRNKNTVDSPVFVKCLDLSRLGRNARYLISDGMADTIIVRMTVNADGGIDALETLYENMPELRVADEFKKALRKAVIFPAVIDGKKTGGEYTLFCIYRRGGVSLIRNTDKISLQTM